MIQKLLYTFVAQETLALLEKINATDSTYDSSYQAADYLHKRGKFNFVERKLLAKALKKVARRETLVGAMNVVVYNNVEGEVHHSNAKQSIYDTAQNAAIQVGPLQGGILQSAAQNAWERQLNQTSLQNSLNPYGVLTASADNARRSQ
tara:strand:- start:1951 stop:2394 length:444 start_codon:yes stop_codon:yes gene_type:complete